MITFLPQKQMPIGTVNLTNYNLHIDTGTSPNKELQAQLLLRK